MKQRFSKNSNQVYLAIKNSTERLVDTRPYKKGWYNVGNGELPLLIDKHNQKYILKNGKCDKIIDKLINKKYQYNVWLTKQRLIETGLKLKKGQKPVKQTIRFEDDVWPEEYNLYNIEQTTSELPKLRNYNHDPRLIDIDDWIKSLPVNISFNGFPPQYLCYYDTITFPHWEQFKTSRQFYSTLFHEIGHWTGFTSRLNRPSLMEQIDDKDPQYGVEEAIAELIAIKLCEYWGIPVDIDQHILYISSWLDFLVVEQKVYMFRYCDDLADKAVEYILKGKF